MPSKIITDAFVRNVKSPRKDDKHKQLSFIHTLERGLALVLVVSYGGTRTFRVMTYLNGKPRSVKLGTYPQMTVKDARAKAREYWENPKKFEAQTEVGSFRDIAENWIKRHVEAKKLLSRREIERILAHYVYPKWKDHRFLEIRRREVNELLDQIADNHGLSQADAVLAVVRGIMTWWQTRDEHYASPIVRGMRRNKDRKSGDRILNHEEIRALWKATDECGSFGALVKTLLLTGQRKGKAAKMKWADVADGVWTIPTDVREKGTGGRLKLPKLLRGIIEAEPRIEGNPFVFAGRGGKAFNAWSQRKAELDEKLPGMMPWNIHDLRRTARSLMSEVGVSRDIAERVLGHAIPGVEGVYDRHHYDDQKADALKRLARLVETIINPMKGNVVVMRGGHRAKS